MMRTTRSSSHHGGVCKSPKADTPGEQAPPQGRHPPPQSSHPLARSPSSSPLGVGLDQIPLNFPLGCWPGPDPPKLPPWVWAWKPARHAGILPPPPPETWCKACWDTTTTTH